MRHGFENRDGDFFLGFVLVAFAVFIGALAAMLVHDEIVEWRVQQALAKAAKEVSRQVEKAEADAARARQADARARTEAFDAAARQRAADDAVARAVRERRERREAAWQRFYQPSEICRIDSATLPCANAHMAARKRFDAQYVD